MKADTVTLDELREHLCGKKKLPPPIVFQIPVKTVSESNQREHCKIKLDRDSLANLYCRLRSVHRVGKELGVTGQTVLSAMRRYGIVPNNADWSDAEKQAVAAYYKNTPPKDFNLTVLARSLRRPYQGVALMASRLGLSAKRGKRRVRHGFRGPKPVPQEDALLPWPRWVKHEHPKGMLGKKHTKECVARLAEINKQRWAEWKKTGTGLMSDKHRQRRSDQRMNLNFKQMFGKSKGESTYSRAKRGKRPDLGEHVFRSSWEANYARYLNLLKSLGQIDRWDYECETFWFEKIKRGVRSYTPDFKIWPVGGGEPYFVELKGWMDAKSKTKLKRMKKYHPKVRIDLVDEKRYNDIAKRSGSLIPNWERKTKTRAADVGHIG